MSPEVDTGSLEAARAGLRALEEPLVRALVERSRLRRNAASLGPLEARAPGGAAAYGAHIVPFLCAPGNDGRGQESAAIDERILDLIAARLAFGAVVAEAKAAREPERFARLAASGDRAALLEAITDAAVERAVLDRIRALAARVGAPPEPAVVAAVFERWLIPLTKEAEVHRLLAPAGAAQPASAAESRA